MNTLSQKISGFLPVFSFALVVVSLVVVFGFIGLEAYIRWSLNQTFTFLGGYELEVLTVSAFALLIVLLFLQSRNKTE